MSAEAVDTPIVSAAAANTLTSNATDARYESRVGECAAINSPSVAQQAL